MKNLKWYQYLAIVLAILSLWFIVTGIIGQNGTLVFVGIALIVGGVQLFRNNDKPKNTQSEKNE